MAFTKGKPKTGGRKIGIPNTVDKELRERVKELVESHFDDLADCIFELAQKERIAVLLKLMEFVLPKATHARVEVESIQKITEGGVLSADQLERLTAILDE